MNAGTTQVNKDGESAPVVNPSRVNIQYFASEVTKHLGRVLVGKNNAITTAVCTLLAGGHLLIEDVPGLGKTLLASALGRCIDAQVRRISFTSDMMPTDVTGVSVFDQVSKDFRFHEGPIFSHIVIADEINRATPKTQSALLEAMGEGRVTVDGATFVLPSMFMVVATQNPQDMEGTYPLPEAQRDRFMTRMNIGYPDAQAEMIMLRDRQQINPLDTVRPLFTVDVVQHLRATVGGVAMSENVTQYLISVVSQTRSDRRLTLGASPRATLHLARMAQARAAIVGRNFVSPDDIAILAQNVLSHRLVVSGWRGSNGEATAAASEILDDIIRRTPVPGLR